MKPIKGRGRTIQELSWFLGAGALAGAGFNVAFGSTVWNEQGLLGGLLSGVVGYLLS